VAKQTRDLMDNIWTEVSLDIVFVDKGKLMTRSTRFSKADMEKEYIDMAKEEGDQVLKEYTMPNERFQSFVMRAASSMFNSPIVVDVENSNQMRLLAPSCVKEVVVTVHNLGQVIVA
jgi:Tfp pilus assembly PilM family ATPase